MVEHGTMGKGAPAAGRAAAAVSPSMRLRDAVHKALLWALAPLARGLAGAGVTPNQVSLAGLALNLAAAGLIVAGAPVAAGAVYLVAGLLDLLDGQLARMAGRASRFGAFLDSTLDRVSEGVVFAAIAYVFAAAGRPVDAALVVLALLGSFLVSYVRARAEGLGVECRIGAVTRAERVVLVGAGLIAGLVAPAVYLLVAATALTVIQRVLHTARALRAGG